MSNDHTHQTDFDRADAGITARREAALKAQAERSGGLNTRAIHAGYTPDGRRGRSTSRFTLRPRTRRTV